MTTQEIINGLNDYIEHPTYMIDPDLLDALSQRMDRVKKLMVASHKSMEELLGCSAEYNVECNECPIYALCHNVNTYLSCDKVWSKYIKGEI